MSETSRSIQKLLDELVQTKDSDLAHEIIAALQTEIVLFPSLLPPGIEPERVKEMIAYASSHKEGIPEGIHPNPCVLNDQQGKKLFPVFTSQEEMEKDPMASVFPMILHLPFGHVVKLLEQTKDVRAIVVNPFSHNMRIDYERKIGEETAGAERDAEQKITEPQFHALVRQYVEATLLPKKLFEDAKAFLDKLQKEGAAYLCSLYEPPYAKKHNCPYQAEDFDVISLVIREDLHLLELVLPEKNHYVSTCSTIFIVWNPVEKKAAYYAIVRKEGQKKALYQVFADETHQDLGEAPREEEELQTIIDLQS